jgi:hypothetical protein
VFESGRAHAPAELVGRAERFYRMTVERLERETHDGYDLRSHGPGLM